MVNINNANIIKVENENNIESENNKVELNQIDKKILTIDDFLDKIDM